MHTTEARPFTAATSKFAFAQVFTAPSARPNAGSRAKYVVHAGRLSALRRRSRAGHGA